jgi:predicted metal-dependent hydrolase
MAHFHRDRDFFECHEILEEHWKAHPDVIQGPLWVGLIQLAVGLYHHRRGNTRGALKMLTSASKGLSTAFLNDIGIDKEKLLERLQHRLQSLQEQEPAFYQDMNIPLLDTQIITYCNVQHPLMPPWGTPSNLSNTGLIHRHTLRDRTPVIQERLRSIETRAARNKKPLTE